MPCKIKKRLNNKELDIPNLIRNLNNKLRRFQDSRWKVKSLGHIKNYRRYWKAECVCGKQGIVEEHALLSGKSKSCGCFSRDLLIRRATTHGKSKSSEYAIYRSMLNRCYNKNVREFRWYGARGIGVCDRWRSSFSNFLEDMGPRPSCKHSLERVNNNKNYEPANVRWIHISEQALNTRRNRLITAKGKTLPLVVWLRKVGIHDNTTFYRRMKRGWSERKSATTPPLGREESIKMAIKARKIKAGLTSE